MKASVASGPSAVGRRIREAREVAAAWIARLGQEPTSNVGAYTLEMLRTLVHDLTLQAAEHADLDVDHLQKVALTLQHIEQASHLNADRERALRKGLAETAATAGEGVARRKGVSAETTAEIRRAIKGAV